MTLSSVTDCQVQGHVAALGSRACEGMISSVRLQEPAGLTTVWVLGEHSGSIHNGLPKGCWDPW